MDKIKEFKLRAVDLPVFFSMLAVLFIGLKLGEVGVVATWSWWLVLLPIWGPILCAAIALLLCFVAVFLCDGRDW